MLEESLRRQQTDHLDVWLIYEVIYDNDPDLIFQPNFNGHQDPSIHLKMLSHDFPFDTVQMPLNCIDATFRSFEQPTISGMESMAVLKQNLEIARGFRPLEAAAIQHLPDRCKTEAVGRKQHESPPPTNCPRERLRLQYHLDALVLLIDEHVVSLRCIVETHLVRHHKARIDLASLDAAQQRLQIPLYVRLARLHG
jgi:hypothetical protein